MLDANGRIAIGKDLLRKAFKEKAGKPQKVKLMCDAEIKKIQIIPEDVEEDNNLYFIKAVTIDKKGRIYIPMSIRKVFPKAAYLPTVRNNSLYLIIIQ